MGEDGLHGEGILHRRENGWAGVGSQFNSLPCIPWRSIPRHGTMLWMAIHSFASPAVARFFREGRLLKGAGWANVAKVAARKLDMLDYAAVLTDLASPPGNRIEALKGNLRGFHSIRDYH